MIVWDQLGRRPGPPPPVRRTEFDRPTSPSLQDDTERTLNARIDFARTAMDGEIAGVRARCRTYLNWFSPPFNEKLGTHDAWTSPIRAFELDLTRANFNVTRPVVEIWTSLEASVPPVMRAEAERVPAPPPVIDQNDALRLREVYDVARMIESLKSDARSAEIRRWHRLDNYKLKRFWATRKKNLYGFSWVKVIPSRPKRRPVSHVVVDPTSVYPIWSSRDPGELEAILVVYQKNAVRANAEYDLGLQFDKGRIDVGQDTGRHAQVNDRWYDSSRTMVWCEEYWWIDRTFKPNGEEASTRVSFVQRVMDHIVSRGDFPGWRYIPFVAFENTDERDAYGWSDAGGVIDINDEINRRLSQEGDIIGQYSSPRFQLLNAMTGRDVEMPGPFEMISLQDQERIEQIITRIDLFPTQQHFNTLIELLHRVSGLPPIVWGMIANAQTSGRALTASWKATETRLAPKNMRNEMSDRRWLDIEVQYARHYDWNDSRDLFVSAREGGMPFEDFIIEYPSMEPRDFQEVTMNAITKRDAGLVSTIDAMRETGDDAAEDTLAEVLHEYGNVDLHPDKVQAKLLAQQALLQNQALAQQVMGPQGGVPNPGTVMQNVGAARDAQQAAQAPPVLPPGSGAPPTGPGAPGNAAAAAPTTTESGTLVRNGDVSNQWLQKGQVQ